MIYILVNRNSFSSPVISHSPRPKNPQYPSPLLCHPTLAQLASFLLRGIPLSSQGLCLPCTSPLGYSGASLVHHTSRAVLLQHLCTSLLYTSLLLQVFDSLFTPSPAGRQAIFWLVDQQKGFPTDMIFGQVPLIYQIIGYFSTFFKTSL